MNNIPHLDIHLYWRRHRLGVVLGWFGKIKFYGPHDKRGSKSRQVSGVTFGCQLLILAIQVHLQRGGAY